MNKKGASDLERSLESNDDILSKIIVFPINQSKQKSTSTLEKVNRTWRFGIMLQVYVSMDRVREKKRSVIELPIESIMILFQ